MAETGCRSPANRSLSLYFRRSRNLRPARKADRRAGGGWRPALRMFPTNASLCQRPGRPACRFRCRSPANRLLLRYFPIARDLARLWPGLLRRGTDGLIARRSSSRLRSGIDHSPPPRWAWSKLRRSVLVFVPQAAGFTTRVPVLTSFGATIRHHRSSRTLRASFKANIESQSNPATSAPPAIHV